MDPSQPLDWTSVVSDADLQSAVCRQMASYGYVVIKPSSRLASLVRKAKKMSKNFFENSKLGTRPSLAFSCRLELTFACR